MKMLVLSFWISNRLVGSHVTELEEEQHEIGAVDYRPAIPDEYL
jgi:hypothetical protein